MSKKFDIAVVGATGAVGETIISILEQRNFPINNLYPLASSRSAGMKIQCQGKTWTVQDLDTFDFTKAQIGLFSAGGSIQRSMPRGQLKLAVSLLIILLTLDVMLIFLW